jgi:predicted metal-dependent hydrolase
MIFGWRALIYWKDFFIALAKYFKPGFHPKQIDDQYLLDLYRTEVQQFS